jgi:hypothetical protein
MKYLLAIMCGVVVLFMGGCAIVSVQAMPLPLLPAGIAALNILALGALFGWKTRWRPAFYILGAIDIILALAALSLMGGFGGGDTQVFLLAAAIIGLKGILSVIYGWKLREAV